MMVYLLPYNLGISPEQELLSTDSRSIIWWKN